MKTLSDEVTRRNGLDDRLVRSFENSDAREYIEMSAQEMAPTRCDSGISGLNQILGGGFPSNALYLVQGDPGVGKTTLALQFLMAGARAGESCLYVTFSETSSELFGVARSHGWSLNGIGILELSNFAQQLTADAESTLFDPADIELQDVTKTVFAEVERIKPTRVVLDSVSELRLLSQNAFDIGVKF